MTYYAFIQDNKIDGCGQCRQLTKGVTNLEVTEEVANNIDDYIWDGENIILDPDLDIKKLQKAKEAKMVENDIARDSALIQGVTYKNVLFDSDTDQKVNLLATVSMMGEEDTIVWFGMDNQPLECNKQDLINIGSLITQLHSFCWNKNAEIKEEINGALTIEELDEIAIDYILIEGAKKNEF